MGLGALLAGGLLLLAACASSSPPAVVEPATALRDPNPSARTRAVREVVRTRDQRFVPDLVEMLDDPDPSVRLLAGAALRDLTGRDTGYRAFAPQADRRAQVADWRAWLAAGRSAPLPPPTAGEAAP